MCKIALIGDYHLNLGHPSNTKQWLNVHREYFTNFLLPELRNNLKKTDKIVQLGDFFDGASNIPIPVLNYAQFVIEKLSQICDVHFIIGNRDLFSKSSNKINALNLFKHIPNVIIHIEPTVIKFFDKSVLMLPWVNNLQDQIDTLTKYKGKDFLFCHSDLKEAVAHTSSSAHRNINKISIESFVGYDKIYSGHLHQSQEINNFKYVGSIFQMDPSDGQTDKGIIIINTADNTEKFITNDISPKFNTIQINDISDIDKLTQANQSDYNEVVISKTLIIDKKVRRLLEPVLETGNFTSIGYLDDVHIHENEKVDTELLDLTKSNLEITSLIIDYINNQHYDDVTKNGIIAEFDEILNIHVKKK